MAVSLAQQEGEAMRRTLIALVCAAFAVAVASQPATGSPGHAQTAKKKCKKPHKSAAAAKKKCKNHHVPPTPGTAFPGYIFPPPGAGDADGDGVPDSSDNCPDVANADQADADMDGKGDVCDACPATANPGSDACPPTLTALTTPAQICIGTTTDAGTVTLSGPAINDTAVDLSALPGDITMGGGVLIHAGMTSAHFDMTGTRASPDVTITATLDATSLMSHTQVVNSLC
jgi:hypothetical protein